ncbi:hypothetical protein TRFO_35192 [Tritrichomonas foetus]|uniref:Uncharacterized protein n=1 Tax=Tritrichomonas foetus TaxID=1144522 RepID=A0A1J4JGX0_9EUKA|nr:hypothetical protein TRFO_35192 [Tritrichomonas foetus]|eukprot:OHS98416.1 hypothetical protein TRFO_35192 [Tritrichomonas foetus]
MSVYSVNTRDAGSNIKSWIPSKCMELTDFDIIDIKGCQNYLVALSKERQAYIKGNVSWMNPTEYSHPTIIPGLPQDLRCVELSVSDNNFAIRTENGQVYVCGKQFSSSIACLYSTGNATQVVVGSKQILISTGSSLIKFSSMENSTIINTKDHKVVNIGAFIDDFLVLLDDGILYSTSDSLADINIESSIHDLYIVPSFLGQQIVYLESFDSSDGKSDFICIFMEGSIVHGFYDSSDDTQIPLVSTFPTFPTDDSCICQVCVTPHHFWFLTSNGKISYITKISDVEFEIGNVPRFKCAPSSFPPKISHMSTNGNEIFFFENSNNSIIHNPIVGHMNVETLPNRTQPFMMHTQTHGSILIDPLGATSFGFRPGDRVISPSGENLIVVGRSDNNLCVKEVTGRNVNVIPLPDLSTILFSWKLCDRSFALLKDISINSTMTVQIDCSITGLSRFCFFKPNDIIEHQKFGRGTIIGERCNALWIKYDDGSVRMCGQSSNKPGSLHIDHKLIHRENVDKVLQYNGIDGSTILIEPSRIGSFEPGCIISTPINGIGVFLGTASGQYAINFIIDGKYCRLIPKNQNLTLLRSNIPTMNPFTCLDSSIQFVDVSIETCKPFNILPCDIIRINDQVAICVGCGKCEDVPSLLFETEMMIKHGLGVGAFTKGPIDIPYERIARISSPGTVFKVLGNGEKVELSIDTDDYKNSKLLPGDEITVSGKHCHVCGIKDNELYIEYEDTKICEKLNDRDFILYYRRVFVPTKVTAVINEQTPKVTGYVDLEHLRDSAVLPCDVIENDEEEKMAVVGSVDTNRFIVSNLENKETSILIVPSGKTSKVLSSVFDADF